MSASSAVEFARNALDRGIEREKIIEALRQAGWPEPDISAALDTFAAVDFPLAVPKPRISFSAQESFNYLLLFSALYWGLWHFIALVSRFIDRLIPDAVSDRLNATYVDNSIRWDVAVLIVAFPIFAFMLWHIEKTIKRDPAKRASGPRKWLTYLTLLLAALVLLGDLVSLIYNFLTGELTTRFALKVLTVGFATGAVFVFFFTGIKRDEKA